MDDYAQSLPSQLRFELWALDFFENLPAEKRDNGTAGYNIYPQAAPLPGCK